MRSSGLKLKTWKMLFIKTFLSKTAKWQIIKKESIIDAFELINYLQTNITQEIQLSVGD